MTQNPKISIQHIVELSEPIMGSDGQPTMQIVFRRKMRVGDLRAFDEAKGDHDSMIKLVARLTDLRPSVVETIALDDWPAVCEKVNGFLKTFADAAKERSQTAAIREQSP